MISAACSARSSVRLPRSSGYFNSHPGKLTRSWVMLGRVSELSSHGCTCRWPGRRHPSERPANQYQINNLSNTINAFVKVRVVHLFDSLLPFMSRE